MPSKLYQKCMQMKYSAVQQYFTATKLAYSACFSSPVPFNEMPSFLSHLSIAEVGLLYYVPSIMYA